MFILKTYAPAIWIQNPESWNKKKEAAYAEVS